MRLLALGSVVVVVLAGMFAGSMPARADESLSELRRQLSNVDDDISVFVEQQIMVKDPNSFIVAGVISGKLTPISRSKFIASLDDAVAQKKLTRADADATIAKYEELKRALDRMLKSLLENKAAQRRQLIDAIAQQDRDHPVAWQSGGGTGQFAVSCESNSGPLPDSGPATFAVQDSQVSGRWGEGAFQGRVAADGTASGTGTGPYGSVTWWGRFWRTSEGALAGRGSISPGPGDMKCSGSWSLP